MIDHMGRPDLAEGPNSPAIAALFRLLDTRRVYVKLSGAGRISRTGLSCTGAPYADAVALAARRAAHAPEHVLWGTDWPHVNLHGPMPDDGNLVDNPARFFGFKD